MKNFDDWNKIKKRTENKNGPTINIGDIYWCRIGINLGTEMDGKNNDFERPVLILKKYSKNNIFILPLSTSIKSGSWYLDIDIKGVKNQIILNQGKTIDSRRLKKIIETISEEKLKQVLVRYVKLLTKDILNIDI